MRITKALATIQVCLLILVSNIATASDLPDGFFIDHGFTYFEMESLSEPVDGKQIDKGWKLEPFVRIYGNAPEHSSIKLVLRQDNKVIGERRTKSTVYSEGDPHLGLTVGSTTAGTMQPHIKIEGGIQGELPPAQGTGEFEVDIYYIDGNSDEEYKAHTYTLNIGKVDKLDAIGGQSFVRPPKYFVSRHQEILSTILTPWAGYQNHGGGYNTAGYRLLWNASPLKQGDSPSSDSSGTARLRCTVDGDDIKLGNKENPQYEQLKALDGTLTANPTGKRFVHVVHSDRNALKYRSGTDYREPLIFYNYVTSLPFEDIYDTYPPEGYGAEITYLTLEKHPGHWQCQWLDNGTLIRTFSWEVEDGKLKPHAEQEEGLTLNPGAILVDTVIPDGGAAFDGRIVPEAVKSGGFYGWEWQSSEMKKLAKKVPEVGKPFPTPSAPEFVPEPDKGPSAAELLKAKQKAEATAKAAQREADNKAHKLAMDAEREGRAAEDEARAADNAKIISDAQKQALADSESAVQSALNQVNASTKAMEDAQNKTTSSGPLHLLIRLILAVLLILSGLILSGTKITDKIPALKDLVEKLIPIAGTIGLVTIGVAIIELILDLTILRPIIANGLPQIIGLAAGGLLAKDKIEKLVGQSIIETLSNQKVMLSFAAIAFGIIHLLIGSSTLL